MKLVVDTNVLVGELLRQRGKELIQHPQLDLLMTERILSETHHEFRKRLTAIVRRQGISESLIDNIWLSSNQLITNQVLLVVESDYAHFEAEAKRRIPRDPNDWQTIALALHLDAGIWTQDYDFFGCGCATWTTETLLLHLQGLN
jgi:predicted nucleic acid-binding protein